MKDLYIRRQERLASIEVGGRIDENEVVRIADWLCPSGWRIATFACDGESINITCERQGHDTVGMIIQGPTRICLDERGRLFTMAPKDFYRQWEPEKK